MDRPDLRVRCRGNFVHRHAAIDNGVIVPANDRVVNHRRVVNLRHFTMRHPIAPRETVVASIQRDEKKTTRVQSKAEIETDRAAKIRETKSWPITRSRRQWRPAAI